MQRNWGTKPFKISNYDNGQLAWTTSPGWHFFLDLLPRLLTKQPRYQQILSDIGYQWWQCQLCRELVSAILSWSQLYMVHSCTWISAIQGSGFSSIGNKGYLNIYIYSVYSTIVQESIQSSHFPITWTYLFNRFGQHRTENNKPRRYNAIFEEFYVEFGGGKFRSCPFKEKII